MFASDAGKSKTHTERKTGQVETGDHCKPLLVTLYSHSQISHVSNLSRVRWNRSIDPEYSPNRVLPCTVTNADNANQSTPVLPHVGRLKPFKSTPSAHEGKMSRTGVRTQALAHFPRHPCTLFIRSMSVGAQMGKPALPFFRRC